MKIYMLFIGISLTLIGCQPAKQEPQSQTPETESTKATEPANAATDYLQVPGPISFNQKEFFLAWSSHPSETYYKHEYLPKGESPERYDQMIMLEVALGDLLPQDFARAKAKEMEFRKSSDELASAMLSGNNKTGEVLLDFMLSEGTGEAMIVEWNSYRYKSYVGPSGQKGIMLFALSKRGYGSQGIAFASDIKSNRKKYAAEFEGVTYPEIKF
jgi:hypothetical protein